MAFGTKEREILSFIRIDIGKTLSHVPKAVDFVLRFLEAHQNFYLEEPQ